jgi:DNA-binding CsgD family transcriptional regulator
LGQSKKIDLAAELHVSLTTREREIALLVARGLRNKAIASELQCSEGTVKVHLHNIFQKLSIKSRWVLIAHACDLLSPATSKPGRTFVDTTPALDEIPHRLIQVLVIPRRTVTHGTICSACNHQPLLDQTCNE